MDLIKKLIANNKQFIKKRLEKDLDYFKKLSIDQNPPFLIVGCSDSRVPPEIIFNGKPGDFFMHRNIANQINVSDDNMMAVLEYAIFYLKIKNIILLGHYNCGGIGAAVRNIDDGIIAKWIKPIKVIIKDNQEIIKGIKSERKAIDKISEINVVEQVKNIFISKVYENAVNKEIYPRVHGFVFDINTGLVKKIDLPYDKWLEEGIIDKATYKKMVKYKT